MQADEVSRLDLERLALGTMSELERSALASRMDHDPTLARRARRIALEIEESAEALPPLQLPVEEAGGIWERFNAWMFPAGLMLAAAASLFVLLPRASSPTGPAFRGALDVELVRVRLGEPEPFGLVGSARAGDRLQFSVTAPADGWVAVYDVQDDGVLATWLAPTEARGHHPVDGAVVLDDYTGAERVYFVYSNAPVSEEDVREALERAFDRPLAELDVLPALGRDVVQRSVLVLEE